MSQEIDNVLYNVNLKIIHFVKFLIHWNNWKWTIYANYETANCHSGGYKLLWSRAIL